MNKEEWEEYITWEERVTDKLERWVKYNKPITREQAEETIDFICEQDNVIDRKIRELDKYKNIVDELEKFLINSIEESDLKGCSFEQTYITGKWNAYKKSLNKLKELKGE